MVAQIDERKPFVSNGLFQQCVSLMMMMMMMSTTDLVMMMMMILVI